MDGMENDVNTNDNKINNNEKENSPWPKITSISDIQKQSRNWTLAGDAGLLCYLHDFSQQLISKTHEMEKTVDQLIHETKVTSSKINNTINDFLMLSNIQFIENRVYDDDIQTETNNQQNKQEEQTKEQREAEIIPQISIALALGLEVIDKAFDKVDLQQDSDSEDEGRTVQGESILEPKDPYLHRPLPHIIGSKAFHNDDTVGLDLIMNEIESENESDVKEYESEKESSSDESFKEEDRIKKVSIQDERSLASKNVFEKLPNVQRHSESDSTSSDLFRDEEEYLSASTETDEFIKEEKVNNEEQSISKSTVEVEDTSKDLFNDDMFSSNRSEEIPYSHKPSTPSKNNLFDSDIFEDPFDDIAAEEKSSEVLHEKNQNTLQEKSDTKGKEADFKNKQSIIARDLEGLFHSGDDDDLFIPNKILEKNRRRNTKTERTKTISLFDDEEEEEKLFSEPSPISVSPMKNDLFKEKETFDKPQVIEKHVPSDIKPSTEPKTEKVEADSLFFEDSEDDLFGVTEKERKPSPFESIKSENLASKSVFTKPTLSEKSEETEKSKSEQEKPVRKPSLFSFLDDDEGDDDLFSLPVNDKKSKASSNFDNKGRSGSSLFEDEELFGKENNDSPEVDLFAATSKSNINIKKEILDSQRKLSDAGSSPTQPKVPIGGVSLFGGIDLFGKEGIKSSSPEKEVKLDPQVNEIKTSTHEKEIHSDSLHKVQKSAEKLESNQESVIASKKEEMLLTRNEQESLDFDQPVDTSNILSCAGKNRAKIQTRRRPPSRRSRQLTPSSSLDSPENSSAVSQSELDNVPLFKKEETVNPILMEKEHDILLTKESKEVNLDITSPSTEEDDIFPLSNGSPHKIPPLKESNISFADNLFLDIKDDKSNNLIDDIFSDDIFASKPKPIKHQHIFPLSPEDDIFADSSLSKDTSSLFSSSSKIQNNNKEDNLFSSDSLDDIFSSPATKILPSTNKKQSSVKKVKIESNIFEDPLLSFGNSDKE